MLSEHLVELVKLAQNGDEAAQQALYLDRYKSVYFLALKILCNGSDAEDITQDVFITAFEKLPALKEPSAFYRWLNTITANKCTDVIRKKNDEIAFGEDETENILNWEDDNVVLPEGGLDAAETRRMILETVDTLPEKQRICVYYYYYQQLTIAQISENLNCSEGTVKSRLSTARGKIRAELERKNKEEGIKLYGVPLALAPILHQALQEFVFPKNLGEQIWGNVARAINVGQAVQGGSPQPQGSNKAGQTQHNSVPAGTSKPAPPGAGAATVSIRKKKLFLAICAAITGIFVLAIIFLFQGKKVTTSSLANSVPAVSIVLPASEPEPEPEPEIISISVEPGNYPTWQTIELNTTGVEIFYTTDGTIPTIEAINNINHVVDADVDDDSEPLSIVHEYTNPVVTLGAGTTTITAVAKMQDDSLSEDFTFIYNIVPDDYLIEWADPTVEQGVRAWLQKPEGDIYRSELDKIDTAEIFGSQMAINPEKEGELVYAWGKIPFSDGSHYTYTTGVASYTFGDGRTGSKRGGTNTLEDFRHFFNLTSLTVSHANISDISILSEFKQLSQLRKLTLDSSSISDISPLAALNKLESLTIELSNVSDITPLAGLTELTSISLGINQISDIGPLAGLVNLEKVSMGLNKINDISALSGLSKLKTIVLFDNQITDINPLAGLVGLENLHLSNNQISDITSLTGLTELKDFRIGLNRINNISPFAGFNKLEYVELFNNQITDINSLSGLKNLTFLAISNNNLSDISPLAGLSNLESLFAWTNPITDWSPVAHVPTVRKSSMG